MKLISKIAALSVGLAMAIGVGVAVGSKEAKVAKAEGKITTLAGISSGTKYYIGATVSDTDYYWCATGGVEVGTSLSGTAVSSTSEATPVTFSGASSSWSLQFENGNYLSLATSKANGKYNVVSDETNFTISEVNSLLKIAIDSTYCIQLNTSTKSQFGSYNGGQTNVWLEEAANHGTLVSLAVSGSMTKTSYTTSESWSPAGLTVMGTYDSSDVVDVTSSVNWSYSPASPAVSVTSVTATATIGEISSNSDPQSVTVTVQHAGTAEDPFTVAEALAKCAEIGTVGATGQGPWVTTGIISRVTSAPAASYWNATYYISDDGSQTNELQVYRGFYLDNAKFDAETAQLMKAGMIVTVTGNLTGSYGSEYCQGNYLLSIESPSTGDVDVVFEPTTSFEIGATGTFTASSETSGVVFSWEVEDSSILSVNASSGAFEALALGVTKVTVTATAGGKEGSASAYITVNGASYMTVNAANELAATVPTGQTTGYYVYVEGFVSAFDVDSKTRALNITSKGEDSTIMVFVGASGYSAFIDGLQVGMCLRVKANVQNYNGTYELTNPVKEYSEYVAMTFAREFLDSTDAICEGYDGVSSNKAALEAIWSGFETKYDSLSDVQKNTLMEPTTYGAGNTVKDAMERYDYLTGKYELDNFITGRTPVQFVHVGIGLNDVASDNNTMIIVVVIAAVSALAFTALLVFKKKKQK